MVTTVTSNSIVHFSTSHHLCHPLLQQSTLASSSHSNSSTNNNNRDKPFPTTTKLGHVPNRSSNNNNSSTQSGDKKLQKKKSSGAASSTATNNNNVQKVQKHKHKQKHHSIPMIDDGTGEEFDMFDSWFQENEVYNEKCNIERLQREDDDDDDDGEYGGDGDAQADSNKLVFHDKLSSPSSSSSIHSKSNNDYNSSGNSSSSGSGSSKRKSPDPFASLKSRLYNSHIVRLARQQSIEAAKLHFKSLIAEEQATKWDYDAMVFAYGEVGDVDGARQVFEENRKLHFPLPEQINVDSLAIYAGVLFKMFRFESVIELLSPYHHSGATSGTGGDMPFSQVVDLWWPNTHYVFVSSLTRLGKLNSAIEFINELHKRDIMMHNDHLYRIVIDECCAKQNIAQAEQLFKQMIGNRIVPSEEVASTMLNALVNKGEYTKSIQLLYSMRKYGYTPRPQTIPAIYKQLKEGDTEKCAQWLLVVHRMFPDMELTLALTKTLINSLDRTDVNRATLKTLVNKFQSLRPDQFKSGEQLTVERKIEQFNTSIRALAPAKDLKRVNDILHIMTLQGLPITESTRFQVFYVSTYYSIHHAKKLFEQEMAILGPQKITFQYYKYLFRAYLRFRVKPVSECYKLFEQMIAAKVITQPSHLEYLLLSCYQYKAPEVMIYLLTQHEKLFPSHIPSMQTSYYCIRVLSSTGYTTAAFPILDKMRPETPPALIVKKVLSGLQKDGDSAGIVELFSEHYFAPSSNLSSLALRITYVMADYEALWSLASLLFHRDPSNFDYEGYLFLFKRRTIMAPGAKTVPGDVVAKETVTIYHRKDKQGEMLRRLPHHFTSERAALALDIFFELRKRPSNVTGEVLQGVYNKLVTVCEEYPEHRHHLPAILNDLKTLKDSKPTLQMVVRIGNMFNEGYRFPDEEMQEQFSKLVKSWTGNKIKTEKQINVIYRVHTPQKRRQISND